MTHRQQELKGVACFYRSISGLFSGYFVFPDTWNQISVSQFFPINKKNLDPMYEMLQKHGVDR